MRIKIGKHTNEFELFDDEGEPLNILVAEMHMHIHPMEMTKVEMTVYVDELDVEVDEEWLTTKRKTKP